MCKFYKNKIKIYKYMINNINNFKEKGKRSRNLS